MHIKKLIIPIIIFVIIAIVIYVIFITVIVNNESDLQFYKLSEDSIPTINNVLSDRRQVSKFTSEVVDDVIYKQYTYCDIVNVIDDIKSCIIYLRDQEAFRIITDLNPGNIKGQVVLVKKSPTSGKDIQITIDYNSSSYTVSLEKPLK